MPNCLSPTHVLEISHQVVDHGNDLLPLRRVTYSQESIGCFLAATSHLNNPDEVHHFEKVLIHNNKFSLWESGPRDSQSNGFDLESQQLMMTYQQKLNS